jgi:hypothetical protein
MTRDYKRHGTTDLFAAMNVATGEVLYDTRRSHKTTDVRASFKLVYLHLPRHLEVHVLLDNLFAHKAERIAAWLAHRKRARWHPHFMPASLSWLNLVEGRFSLLTERRLTRGVFSSVDDLVTAIETRAEHWNDELQSLVWKKLANEIVSSAKWGRSTPASVKPAMHD